jgi:aminomethyltransferase
VSIGTAFHPRTAPLNRKMQWREWSGYFAASAYADAPDIEYNAIREAAALIDVSPLYKYRVSGPDSMRLVDRIITRDATKLAVDQVFYTSWCDEHGKVVDDGTVTRLDETTYRWTAADPSLRWFRMNARGLDVQIEEISETLGALALQGPLSRAVLEAATEEDFSALKYFRRRPSQIRGIPVDVSRTGYTGDLGYELWVDADRACDLWDAAMDAGTPYGIRPAGMLALDVVRVEAGLILLEVDYTSSRHALIPEQAYSPFELGILGGLTRFDKADYVGKRALEAEQAACGPARRLVGLEVDWMGIERLFAAQDLPPILSPLTSREHVPVLLGRRQVGRATSTTWSPILKKALALASVRKEHASEGTHLDVEWTVEARRGRAAARIVPLPFFDPPRKRG